MARPMLSDTYPNPRSAGPLPAITPLLRRLKVLVYLTVALGTVAILGSFLPLGTWLLLCGAFAVPTFASALLVASD